jgi:hypothetical protein
MKCWICKEKCDGKLVVKDPYITEGVICCKKCFNYWANQEYGKLIKRLK